MLWLRVGMGSRVCIVGSVGLCDGCEAAPHHPSTCLSCTGHACTGYNANPVRTSPVTMATANLITDSHTIFLYFRVLREIQRQGIRANTLVTQTHPRPAALNHPIVKSR